MTLEEIKELSELRLQSEQRLQAEVERLRAVLTLSLPHGFSNRNETIEECARVADGFGDKYYFMSAVDIAAAIRTLKDKP